MRMFTEKPALATVVAFAIAAAVFIAQHSETLAGFKR